MNLMTKKICANVCAAVMSITAVGICGELLLDNKSVGAEKAPAVQVKNVEAQSVKTTAATEVYDFVKFKKSSVDKYDMSYVQQKKQAKTTKKKASASEFTVEMPEDKGEYYDIKNDPANFTDTRSVADEYYTVNDIISGNIVTLNGHELLCQIVNSEIGGEWGEEAIKAQAVAAEPQKSNIAALISYYKTGDLREFDRYNIGWVKDTVSNVDFVNGFIEDYGDPLGRKASWEGIVDFMDKEACHRTEVISENAQWFEDHSPVDPRYRKEKVKGVSAKVITVAMLGGDCYPATPIGIHLPNADWIRKEYGSKSVTIDNITYAYDMAAHGNGFNEEFVLRADDRAVMDKYGKLADDLHTDLHECLGHGSGQLAPGVKGGELKSYSSTLEETRADLFGLYYLGDPKMVELGLVPSFDVAKAGYAKYILNGMMTQLARIEPGKNVEESHMRNRKLICEWCYERGKADNVIEMVRENGKTYVVVNDYEKLRGLFGDMLREIQRIKSEGDYEAGRALVERYAVQVDPELHKEVRDRYYALSIEPYGGFVNPEFELVEKDGEIVDVKISYPADYVKQMLGYSKNYSFLPNIN